MPNVLLYSFFSFFFSVNCVASPTVRKTQGLSQKPHSSHTVIFCLSCFPVKHNLCFLVSIFPGFSNLGSLSETVVEWISWSLQVPTQKPWLLDSWKKRKKSLSLKNYAWFSFLCFLPTHSLLRVLTMHNLSVLHYLESVAQIKKKWSRFSIPNSLETRLGPFATNTFSSLIWTKRNNTT